MVDMQAVAYRERRRLNREGRTLWIGSIQERGIDIVEAFQDRPTRRGRLVSVGHGGTTVLEHGADLGDVCCAGRTFSDLLGKQASSVDLSLLEDLEGFFVHQ